LKPDAEKDATGLVQAFFTDFDEGAPSALAAWTTTRGRAAGLRADVTRDGTPKVNFLGALVSPPARPAALPTFTTCSQSLDGPSSSWDQARG